MLLHSFGQNFKPWSEYAKSIRSELQRQSRWPMDIVDHSLVTARTSDEDPEAPFVVYLRALHASQPPDLIVSIGAPAAAFVQRHRPELFPNVPMVLTAVDERRVQSSLLSVHDTVVAVRIDYLGAMQNILRVLPDTSNVMVVVGTSPIEQFWKAEIANSVRSLRDRVSFTWTDHLSFADLLKRAASLPPRTALFWELMIVDAAGIVHEGNAAISRLHRVSSAPIFSYDESFFGREIVGGPLLAVLDTSRQTAAVAVRILAGERASGIKTPPVTFSTPQFDWREMQRWGILESRLPERSEVHFREPTAWQRYRWQITLMCVGLLGQLAFISWLLFERYQRRIAQGNFRVSEERMQFAAASAGVGLWQYEIGTKRLWSSTHCRMMFGLRPDQPLTTQSLLSSVHPEDLPVAKASVRAATYGMREDAVSEFRVTGANGETRWLQAFGRTGLGANGRAAHVSGIVRDVTNVKMAQLEAQQLRQRVLSIQDDERQRIAQELHDSTAQHLAAIGLNLMALNASINSSDRAASILTDIEASLGEASKELRAFTYLLHPPALVQEGLAASLERYIDGFRRRTMLDVVVRIGPESDQLPQELQEAILRVAQEALANVHRHARATRVTVQLRTIGKSLHLVIKDDGRGLCASEQGQTVLPGGLGVTGMGARVRRLGGKFAIRSSSAGTAVHVLLPSHERYAPMAAE
jgi:PAS domain S-box-containing protein